jgi:hypothetical protein
MNVLRNLTAEQVARATQAQGNDVQLISRQQVIGGVASADFVCINNNEALYVLRWSNGGKVTVGITHGFGNAIRANTYLYA